MPKKKSNKLKDIVNQQLQSSMNTSDYNNRTTGGENEKDEEKGINTDSLAYIITKKYARLQNRVSLLDSQDPRSTLNKSIFKGFNNLIAAFGTIMIIAYPLLRYQQYGQVFNENLFKAMNTDIWMVLLTWPLFYVWAHTALLLQKLIIWGLNNKIAIVIQHTTQSLMFIYTINMLMFNDWGTSHVCFMTMLSCTHFMKMHSYTVINNDYRKDYLEAKKGGYKPVSIYPNNINIKDFTAYMWAPILVYQADFPRTTKFRKWYFCQKVIQFFIGIVALYVLMSDYVSPYVELGSKISAFELLTHVIIPLFVFVLIAFYIVWDCMCNAFAEISYFGDRYFYRDWWNSTTFEEFNSKWNKVVYNFLFRHVYLESYYRYKCSKKLSQFLTFFFSALLHEWILMAIFKIVRPFMTAIMVLQIPLFLITSSMYTSRSGNLLMWFGLVLGIPLISIIYLRSDPSITQMFAVTE